LGVITINMRHITLSYCKAFLLQKFALTNHYT
jgi:hypothetical protein